MHVQMNGFLNVHHIIQKRVENDLCWIAKGVEIKSNRPENVLNYDKLIE